MTTDEQLMLEFQGGSKDAFAELFGRYRDPVHGFFRRRLADAARAEELAQETFIAILRAVVRYEPRALFRTYLYSIAVRQLAAERRKTTFRDSWSKPLASEPGVNDGVEEGLAVREALAQLDADDREVLMLREYEELSYAEIAGLQRVPVNTVRSRLFRARQALKELMMNSGKAKSPIGEGIRDE
jgi:RNA polymerase sigma-70 factor (ECF subfamily)